jgi:hypothetical protein
LLSYKRQPGKINLLLKELNGENSDFDGYYADCDYKNIPVPGLATRQ